MLTTIGPIFVGKGVVETHGGENVTAKNHGDDYSSVSDNTPTILQPITLGWAVSRISKTDPGIGEPDSQLKMGNTLNKYR